MDLILSRKKICVAILALVVGCLISSFSFNVAGLEKLLALKLISLIWLQIIFFLAVLLALFPALYFAYHYGLKLTLIAAASFVLISSAFYLFTINVYIILLSRIFDGMTMACLIAISYYYIKENRDYLIYLLMTAIGILLGPYCSHYQVEKISFFSFSTLFFILLPLAILFLVVTDKSKEQRYQFKPLYRVWKKTVLIGLMILSLALLSIYNSEEFWKHLYTWICGLVFLTSLVAFIFDIRKDNHTGLVLLGLKGQVSIMVALNIIFITTLLSFWSTVIPVYLAQVSDYSRMNVNIITIMLHLFMIIAAFSIYYFRTWQFSISQYIFSYLGIIVAGFIVVFLGVNLTAIEVMIFCLVLGFSMGLTVISYFDIMQSTHMKASQISFQLVFYFCFAMLIGYLPLIHYFFYLEVTFNADYLKQYKILLPESMGNPYVANYLLLSNKSDIIAQLKQFTANDIAPLKQGLLDSFNYSLNQIVYVFMTAALMIMSFSAYVLKKWFR